ncbi:MAG TPA: hypothetical protein VG604_01235 [Candidatus Saccharimonadales bacterium]|nr:hypothetical protein [Candidatus Saccharimonadales bacterium]
MLRKQPPAQDYRLHEHPTKSRGRPRIYRKRNLAACFILIAIIFVMRLVSAPVQGHNTKVDVQLKQSPTSHHSTLVPASQQSNRYYRLNLPVGYSAQPIQNVAGLLVSQTITKPGALGSLIINIAVKNMPEGGLGNDSSYRARQQDTARYRLTSQNLGGDNITISNDSQSEAVAAFWPHGGYLATIGIESSIQNPATDDNADELRSLQAILTAWQWQ